MPISRTTKNGKEYWYFFMGTSKRMYLGTSEKPMADRIELARQYIEKRIRGYEDELHNLESLLQSSKKTIDHRQPLYYRIVFFDLDGVIFDKPWHTFVENNVAVSSWDILFQALGIYKIHEKLKDNFINKIFKDYMEWTDAACNVLKSVGLQTQVFDDVIKKRPLTQGALELFQKLKEDGVRTAIISGSFEALAQRASKEVGEVDHILAHCKLHFKDDRLDSWELKGTDYEDKGKFVAQIAKQHNVPLERCAYIGDDVNDISAFQKVGLAIAFNAKKPMVRQNAHVVIDSRDLMAVLPHLQVAKTIATQNPLNNRA